METMSNKFIILNLLNKLSNEQKLSWKIKSQYNKGQSNNLLEILIFTLPSQQRKGKITFQPDTGQVMQVQYSGFSNSPAENIVDMLLDVINFEKHCKKAGSTNSVC